ncbi:RNA 2',3'-cyclic phosphodiesterase [Albimonas sp. CAU 1670]|uniref:RNA 2',3'-cyclic phosphodiesterase n=1 Tax=Albimonas sp. CAU 1670 TaxID=3032599 RepID=UPI0023DB9C43|nr:RNA 2',3'-cyclic phosphodiesterase [Albimonas sp. CAU 1670]MDF2234599.1 RNA 2',3'-cyclic phosphodiesterase [Albimonas sp. CAU 1670]
MIRAFVALPLPDPLRDRLEELGEDVDEGRPTSWENLHLTLAFLGERRPELLEDVAVELEGISPPAPTVELRGVGAFGGARPRSAHVVVRPDPALSELRDSIRRACRRGGLDLPHERFTPHVTVARFSTRAPAGEGLARWLARNAAFAAPPFTAQTAVVYRSDLGPDGPIYQELMEIPLL